MSFKKSKLDLLVRVRYSNPLPAPPCPPKLLEIPTNPMRYARPEFLNAIANNAPLPMIVDADCGMPLDLGKWESLWEENADGLALNPDIDNLPKLDPKDELLAFEPATAGIGPTSGIFTNGHQSGTSTPTSLPVNVPWLRKTEYTSSRESQRLAAIESKPMPLAHIDVSRPAQIRDIETSFTANNDDFDLSALRHPNKPNVTAVESYEILPDDNIWANQYDLFRFSERPGERNVDVEDLRLDCAILRPMKSDHDSFLAYYLTKEDEDALKLKEVRSSLAAYEIPEDEEPITFNFIRDYETVKVEQEVPNEFLLVLDDGPSQSKDFDEVFADDEDENKNQRSDRPKGAYYKNIERKMTLKKKRVNQYEEYEDKWEIIRLTHTTMSKEEEDEREEALAEVLDPMYMTRMMMRADGEGEADADGEVDTVEVDADGVNPTALEVFGDGF
ncbi:RNA polymerase II-associated protein [Dendrothele bispora CBS 962.96]|uniref:RNA polymerase II-associated protein n=1 Tax=Dendrothele bispora (strain CBS 962.96) TaxID=1314807 RepID=A0A4S8LUF8_DENBC|nr:RNA polymerase II-associated protein [Dendrothele bispora CBS 962.96]